jgi:dihydrofolate reductase
MRRLMVLEMVTLDGVMQAPGGREEDQRGGFTHGGWSVPYNDPVKMQVMGEGMAQRTDMLFGRWTYEKFYDVWHGRTDNPFTSVFERSRKYVASRTLSGPLPWVNSTLLEGDAADAVARLKQEPGPDLLVMGSGVLAQSLMRHGLVDEYQLLIHPLVLGSGRRLFTDGVPGSQLRLVKSVPTTTGVIITTYQPADGAARREA